MKAFNKGLVGLLIATSLFGGCGRKSEAPKTEAQVQNNERTGQSDIADIEPFVLGVGCWKCVDSSVVRDLYISYCGMPNSDTFCMTFYIDDHRDLMGSNYYYPSEENIIMLEEHKFRVISVNPREIKLRGFQEAE